MLYVNSKIRNAYLESKEAPSYPEMKENSYLFKSDEDYRRPVYRRPVKGPALSAYYKF